MYISFLFSLVLSLSSECIFSIRLVDVLWLVITKRPVWCTCCCALYVNNGLCFSPHKLAFHRLTAVTVDSLSVPICMCYSQFSRKSQRCCFFPCSIPASQILFRTVHAHICAFFKRKVMLSSEMTFFIHFAS